MPTNFSVLALDIGSNSVGSAWIDREAGAITTGVSVFPAGVDESDDKRGEPKNAKRRMTRRTRITLARRAQRKRELRLKLIEVGLLPTTEADFITLLEQTDPWELRRRGLDSALSPFEFGRVLLHLAQRRGALGLRPLDEDSQTDDAAGSGDDGRVKAAIDAVRKKMIEKKARTFGEFIGMVRDERVTAITTEDRRPTGRRKGPRKWRSAVRNKAASYEHCADRPMIRDEFAKLWDAQTRLGGQTATLLSAELRLALDDESGDSLWRHKGLLFGQRRQSWDLGTLGRCNLHPDERCVPHADMDASRYLVIETINNLKIIERGKEARYLTPEERQRIKEYLSGPLGVETRGKRKGHPKRTVTVTDLRNLMGGTSDGWGRATKSSRFRFNIENDEDRIINTDWFSREVVHGAVTLERWAELAEQVRNGLNRAIVKYDPDEPDDASKLRAGVMDWGGLTESQADAVVAAWMTRPKPDAKRLNMGRTAVRNLLTLMDRSEPWPDVRSVNGHRWLTQIEARKLIAEDADFLDASTGEPFDDITRRRYATGSKGATARDRYYMAKHVLMHEGRPVIDRQTGKPLAEPPPAPLISNPVVRKAIHEVRRHLVEYMIVFGRKPDEVYIELAREARMGKVDADRVLFRNRLRNRIRNDIIHEFQMESLSSTQQRAAVDRVVLCVQQGGVCPLCGEGGLTPVQAANGQDCEVAHVIPRASGGHSGLSNIVLSHTPCNRDMARRTPRHFWSAGPGFETAIARVEGIYGDIQRIKGKETRSAHGLELWRCYFTKRDDLAKIEQFKKDIKDIQEMTQRQEAATKYAARQVMAYLADALYEGKGLPERGGERRIFATDGLWTSRLRREWGLLFDTHSARAYGLSNEQEHERKEKNRADHRHHAVDAIVIANCTRPIQIAWEEREQKADRYGINTADEESMDNFRRLNPLKPPSPFGTREKFREAVEHAVFGDRAEIKPICHRPVKRKLIGALHEETLFGPVLDKDGRLTDNFTAKKATASLTPNHLRIPDGWDERSAKLDDDRTPEARKRAIRAELASMRDPPPGKPGIVRDRALRDRIRKCLRRAGIDPDKFTATEIKKVVEAGAVHLASGVPIHSVVLLRTMTDPVVVDRKRPEYRSGRMVRDGEPAAKRAYVGGNNHHIEIRVDDKGTWSGRIVSAFEAGQRNLARLRALREADIPRPKELRTLPRADRARHNATMRAIEHAHPLVDRRDDAGLGGRFVMSLCEGEMLRMKHKHTGQEVYFVVAKLDKPQSIVLVPHWDARSATERKDAEGKKVPDSKREQFAITPRDLKGLAPESCDHALKVRVSSLGRITILEQD